LSIVSDWSRTTPKFLTDDADAIFIPPTVTPISDAMLVTGCGAENGFRFVTIQLLHVRIHDLHLTSLDGTYMYLWRESTLSSFNAGDWSVV
jgi:hypothetical protein